MSVRKLSQTEIVLFMPMRKMSPTEIVLSVLVKKFALTRATRSLGSSGSEGRSRRNTSALRFRICGFPGFQHLDLHRSDSAGVKTDAFGTADGHVDDSTLDIRPPVGDADDFRLAIRHVGYSNPASQRECLVRGRGGGVRQPFTARCAGAVVRADGIPRRFAVLHGFHVPLIGRLLLVLCGVFHFRTSGKEQRNHGSHRMGC